eukprot:619133-Prorocentrum_minimum.AAC.1
MARAPCQEEVPIEGSVLLPPQAAIHPSVSPHMITPSDGPSFSDESIEPYLNPSLLFFFPDVSPSVRVHFSCSTLPYV